MKKMNIVVKIIFPLFFGLFLIATVSIYTNFYFLEKNIMDKSNNTFDSISRLFKNIVQQDTNIMLDLLEQIKQDKTTQKLFLQKNREELFKHLEKKFLGFKKRHDITHFYLHDVDKKNFLRVHNKTIHSDIIDRITLENAIKTQRPSSGIEFGILHNLTLRVVIPWIVQGKLIGYLELGKEIDKLTPELLKVVNVDLIFTVKKSLIKKEDFQKWKNSSNRNRYYEEIKNFYLIDSTLNNIEPELKQYIDKLTNETNHYIENNGKQYYVNSRPFFDIDKKTVGNIHTLIDVTDDYTFIYHLIIKVSLIVSILIFFMLVYYIRFLKDKENELKDAYEEIQKLSITDGLTGVYNKRHYLENGPKQLSICSRCNGYISFILVDVDNFKKYNDRYGHLKGDNVLLEVTNMMKHVFQRSSDCLYRVGGEEFLIISKSEHEHNNMQMAEKLRHAIEKLNIEHKENESYGVLTVSIGVCTAQATITSDMNELYKNADKALYQSKHSGRNQITLFK